MCSSDLGRTKVAPSKTRHRANKTPGKARSHKGSRRCSQKAVSETFTRGETPAQAREPSLSIKAGIVDTRKARGGATLGALAFGRREESSAHTKASSLRCSVVRGEETSRTSIASCFGPLYLRPPFLPPVRELDLLRFFSATSSALLPAIAA